MAFCEKCGSEILDKFGFCPKCGNKLTKRTSVPPKPEGALAEKKHEPSAEQVPAGNASPAGAGDPIRKNKPLSEDKAPKKKKKWPLVLLIIVLVLALAGGGVFAFMKFWPFGFASRGSSGGSSELALTEFASDEHYFFSGEDNTVTFTVKLQGDADEITLLCDGSAAGVMKDDGSNGDASADDGIYTAVVTKPADDTKSVVEEYQAKSGEVSSDTVKLYYFNTADFEKATEDIDRVDSELAELESTFNADGTDEEKIESAKKLYNDIVSYFDKLVEDGTVIEYSKDKNVIFAVFRGVTYAYVFDLGEEDVQSSFSGGTSVDSDNVGTVRNTESSGTATNGKRVVSIQPYASELRSKVFDNAAEAVGELYGYSHVKKVDDDEVTVSFLKTLDEYDVIIWDGHGAYGSVKFHSCVSIVPDPNDKLSPSDFSGDYPALIKLKDGAIFVTPYFFEKYYESGDFDGALIFMGCCYTANDDYLANVFLNYGAKAYFGYQNTVYTKYNRNMTETLFESLTEWENQTVGTKTVSAALAEAKAEHGESDPTLEHDWWYKVKVHFGWAEEKDPAVLTLICDEENEDFRLLVPSGTLAGKVCKASDRITPIENARIEVYSGDKLCDTLESDAEGNYMVDLPVGSYRLEITAEGYIDFTCLTNVTAFTCTYTETFLLIVGEESELGRAEGIIRHALTGDVESAVTITIYESWNNNSASDEKATAVTDRNGEYSVELPLGNYTLKASKNGFVDCYFNIIVQSGVTDNQNGTITPSVSGDDFLITLTWGAFPSDLDSHVVGTLSDGSYFHVDYQYSENQDYDPIYEVLDPPVDKGKVVCRLDCDDIESFGPEHVTLHTTTNDAYYYFINNFSEDGTLTHSNAYVTIHQGNNLIADFHVPTNQADDLYWNVFAIKDGEIIVMNTITDEPDVEYAD